MCTAISYKTKEHYFGRNLDLEYSYKETVTITPRNYHFSFRGLKPLECHYAIIGMAYVVDNYPLYYDGTNEEGLSMAGLNFPDNAYYPSESKGLDNIAPFEFIPWILGQCTSVEGALTLLEDINLVNVDFSEEMPLSPLHWIISDKECSITVEPMEGGLRIFDNPVGVLTNNPPFPYHVTHLCDYMTLSKEPPAANFGKDFLTPYSRGMGAMGLPGDLSSASRFVRAAFVRENAVCEGDEMASVSQFFHILGAVEQVRGCVRLEDGRLELTAYTSCINLDRGIYYYHTYDNRAISAVALHKCDLDGGVLLHFPLGTEQQITWQN